MRSHWRRRFPVEPSGRRSVLVLGSGCYRIGSSVEFDWCCVNAVLAARALGVETIVLNSNPETVSTDYDTSDLLIFDEISVETVLELCHHLRPEGVIVAMGGQTPNSLALELDRLGVALLGTPARSIDRAEDRGKFSALCDELGIDQPRWAAATALDDLERLVAELGGFPAVVRPSYVLSGAAMRVAHSAPELRDYLARATEVSPAHPVVVSRVGRCRPATTCTESSTDPARVKRISPTRTAWSVSRFISIRRAVYPTAVAVTQ